MPPDGWMDWVDKQNVAYTFDGLLFGLKKEGHFDVHCNVGEALGHCAKGNKPVTKAHMPDGSTSVRPPN